MVKKSSTNSLQAQVEQERQRYARYRDVLARRIAEGGQPSPHVHRGLTRGAGDDDDALDASRAERAILDMLRQIQAEQRALRQELERQGALLEALSRRAP